MPRQIVINAAAYETRVAVLEKQKLLEILIERPHGRGLTGNIYRGRVTRVLPGMQAAFVDIGLPKAAYLHGSDLYQELGDEFLPDEGAAGSSPESLPGLPEDKHASRRAPIEERLKKGQEVLVQVAKEPIGNKGARVTAVLSLAGRHLVFIPSSQHVGVSRRIDDEAERLRLKEIVAAERPPDGGFIIRTACEGLTKREIQGDIRFLLKLWNRVQRKGQQAGGSALLHYDLDLVLRTVRDLFTADTQRLVVDNPRDHQRILDFVDTVMPRLKGRIELFEGPDPIFDHFGIESQIAKALDRQVWLKSGGYIVIDHTEALTVIDVNTGRYVGTKNQQDTVLKTNLEAVRTIVEQIRLRNIGGLIVVDFIDMEESADQRAVFDTLSAALRKDKARCKLLPMSGLGLVEMARKRSRESLMQILAAPCPTCDARGYIKSTPTIAYEVLRRVEREGALNPTLAQIVVRAHPAVVQFLQRHEERTLQGLESKLAKKIVLHGAAHLDEGRYEIVGVEAAA